MKKLFSLITLMALILALSGGFSPAFADCQPLYGGGQSCVTNFAFTINKMVQVPGKGGGQYVDNLGVNDPKYSPSQNVNYQIIVTNTGSQTIPTINVTDTFPQFITFVSGVGNFDKDTKVLTFNVSNLEAGKSVTYTLTAKTADANTLPNEGVICNETVKNNVQGIDNNGGVDSDSSQICVQKNVLGATPPPVLPTPKITSTPATGPEMVALLALIPGALGGLILRKKSKNIKVEGGEK